MFSTFQHFLSQSLLKWLIVGKNPGGVGKNPDQLGKPPGGWENPRLAHRANLFKKSGVQAWALSRRCTARAQPGQESSESTRMKSPQGLEALLLRGVHNLAQLSAVLPRLFSRLRWWPGAGLFDAFKALPSLMCVSLGAPCRALRTLPSSVCMARASCQAPNMFFIHCCARLRPDRLSARMWFTYLRWGFELMSSGGFPDQFFVSSVVIVVPTDRTTTSSDQQT